MSNAIIYYFSGTGNTEKAVREYKKIFEEKGVETTLVKITAGCEIPSPKDYDFVGFGYPIHGFNAPEIVLDFAKRIECANKNVFIVKTSGEPLKLNNVSSIKMMKILGKKGYRLTNEYHYAMPYNMIFRHEDGMAALMINKLRELAPADVQDIIDGKQRKLDKVPFGALIAWVFRIEHIAMKVNGRFFKIDESKCIHCMKCVNGCPEHNITYKDGKFVFGNDCVMCTKCSFGCPEDAFSIGMLNGWRVNGAYDFSATPERQKGKHSGYCKRSYDKYFAKK